ncbi:MAG: hypothetical protein RBS39_04790 [Phycisphaerales bacterium]|jgi:hypothetical protein|nr:hypothetical protein [Phycisphaerales bacterium]
MRIALRIRTRRSHASRRGTFLVFVVGTLALLASITVLYVTIGLSDRRNAGAIKAQADYEQVVDVYLDHILSVIGADVTASVVDLSNTQGNFAPNGRTNDPSVTLAEAWDIPGTSPLVQSRFPGNPQGNWFRPEGLWGDDPWLASTEPTRILPTAPPTYLDVRDWSSISNFAPDGQFVNLFALRNNFGATAEELRQDLSIPGDRPPSYPSVTGTAAINRPYLWSINQFGAFRPIVDLDAGPDEESYIPYQWADTDGDGFADARFHEMVDGATSNAFRRLLPEDRNIRWFFAARAIDLSGLVNINVATDFLAGPNPGEANPMPVERTPAGVDLRRLMAMLDLSRESELTSKDLSMAALTPPNGYTPTPEEAAYADYSFAAAVDIGDAAYANLRYALRRGIVLRPGVDVYDVLTPGTDDDVLPVEAKDRHDGYLLGGGFGLTPGLVGQSTYRMPSTFGMEDLVELLTYWGLNDPATTTRLEQAVGGRGDSVNPNYPPSPLRSNVSSAYDRDPRFTSAMEYASTPPTGSEYARALLTHATSLRRLLTTVSGARPFRSGATDLELRESLPALLDSGSTQDLFRAYANVLMPFLSQSAGDWNPASNDYDVRRTLIYGYDGAREALQFAAHLAANMSDSADGDSAPGTYTVVAEEQIAQDWENDTSNAQLGVNPRVVSPYPLIRLPTGKLADTSPTSGTADDINDVPFPFLTIYGIEPQAFIVGAAGFIGYSDRPPPGGDEEWIDGGTAGVLDPGDQWDVKPTIDPRAGYPGELEQLGPDFLFEGVAFQIHNPFDESVSLAAGSIYPGVVGALADRIQLADGAIVLQYGRGAYGQSFLADAAKAEFFQNRYFAPVTPVNYDPGTRLPMSYQGIMIPPRSTIVVYSTSMTPPEIQRRLGEYSSSDLILTDGTNFASWVSKQFGPNAYWVPMISPKSGTFMVPDVKEELNGSATTGRQYRMWDIHPNDRDLNGTFDYSGDDPIVGGVPGHRGLAALWRITRRDSTGVTSLAINDDFTTVPINNVDNDVLVDRFRFPIDVPSLDRKLVATKDVNGILQLDIEDAEPGPEVTPGGPLTPGGTGAGSQDNSGWSVVRFIHLRRPSDSLASGSRHDDIPAYLLEAKDAWNEGSPTQLTNVEGAKDIVQNTELRKRTMRESGSNTLANMLSAQSSNKTLMGELGEDPDEWDGKEISKAAGQGTPFPLRWGEAASGGTMVMRLLQGELEDTDERPRTRPGDALMALGVGPMKNPDPLAQPMSTDNFALDNARWTTLSEALAFASGWARMDPTSGAFPENQFDPVGLFMTDNGTGIGYRGPAYPDPHATADPADPSTRRAKLVAGRLNVDAFTPFFDNNGDRIFDPMQDRIAGTGVPLAWGVFDAFGAVPRKFGTFVRPTFGTININTAPLSVLRAVPFLSPMDPGRDVTDPWWYTQFGTGLPHNQDSDLAAAIVAYRDRTRVWPLSGDDYVSFAGDEGMRGTMVGGLLPSLGTDGDVKWNEPSGVGTPILEDGRYSATRINAIREQPGFRSLGELFAVRDHGVTGSTTYPYPNSMDRLAFDGDSLDAKGFESVRYNSGANDDGVIDDLEERLSLMNAVTPSLSVRSDYFAVWFVVHGYRESDVTGLTGSRAKEPMTPSIKRRFLVIVDRSNVVQPGDRPRVLAFRELPY